jgi:dephospho-CoA kinase
VEFGPSVIDREGGVDRAALRGIVFDDSGARHRLERILHPEVRKRCLAARERIVSGSGVRLFLAEVPLLYESGFDLPRDYEIVVAASPQRQRARLCEHRGLSPEMADRILSVQWPILRKVERADIVIWNGGSLACLKRQAVHLSHRLGIPA